MNRILFLDIDGVLNRRGTRERCNGFIGVDRRLSNKLLKWLHKTDVQIVLSSTWRKHPDMWPHLNEAGITWVGITPTLGGPRGLEIAAFLKANPTIADFAIIDDDGDMLPDQIVRFVKTENAVGLTDQSIDRLNAIFNHN